MFNEFPEQRKKTLEKEVSDLRNKSKRKVSISTDVTLDPYGKNPKKVSWMDAFKTNSNRNFGDYVSTITVKNYKKVALCTIPIGIILGIILAFTAFDYLGTGEKIGIIVGFGFAIPISMLVARPFYGLFLAIGGCVVGYPLYLLICAYIDNRGGASSRQAERAIRATKKAEAKGLIAADRAFDNEADKKEAEMENYEQAFEEEVTNLFPKFFMATRTKEIVKWLYEDFGKKIRNADRSADVSVVRVNFPFFVGVAEVKKALSIFNYAEKGYGKINGAVEQVTLTRVLMTLLKECVENEFMEDPSGTKYEVKSDYSVPTFEKGITYNAEELFITVTFEYSAVNGNS